MTLKRGITLSGGTIVRLGVGFLTWLVAAHLYPPSEIGLAAAVISAMTLCVQVGTMGVDLAVIYLLPTSRHRADDLLDSAIAFGAAAALVVSCAFIGLAAAGFDSLDVLARNGLYAMFFLLLSVFQASWWIMDQASIAKGRPDHLLIRASVDGTFTLLGLAALGIAGVKAAAAILGSWVVAAFAASTVAIVQLGRVPGGYRFKLRLRPKVVRDLLKVGLPNFALTAADNAPSLILPIVVAEALSPRDAAFWYAVWMIAIAAYTIPTSFGLNMFADIANSPSQVIAHVRNALRSGLLVAGVATVGLFALGPLVLAILGRSYAAAGGGALRIVALATVPMAVLKVYLFTCRALQRMSEGILVAGGVGVLAIALALGLASPLGLPGIASGWTIAQTVGALAIVLRLRLLVSRTTRDPAAIPLQQAQIVPT